MPWCPSTEAIAWFFLGDGTAGLNLTKAKKVLESTLDALSQTMTPKYSRKYFQQLYNGGD